MYACRGKYPQRMILDEFTVCSSVCEIKATSGDEIILNERLKEFATEGKAWFDLIRFGKVFERVETLKGRENEQNILLWPVNDASINTNKNITQTPGYN